MNYFSSYNDYLKKTFGTKVRKVMIDAGFTCPNIDGKIDTNGCLFCNNKAFSNMAADSGLDIESQIELQLDINRNKNIKYLAYFQPFTNTYGDPDRLYSAFSKVRKYEQIIGIIVGTRADEVDHDKMIVLNKFREEGYYISVELGVQTCKDETLLFINRGHLFDSVIRASQIIQQYDFDLGCHVILGLPMEDSDDYINTSRAVSSIGFDIVKIHQLQVFKDTRLHSLYHQGIVDIMPMGDYLRHLVTFLEHLSPHMIISRLYAQAKEEFLVAPKWNFSRDEFLRSLLIEFNKRKTYQGKYYKKPNIGYDKLAI